MFFPDVLKFLNRLGVRPVNDVTAQVTADVTAGMDPEGMGAHMGLEQTLVPAELVTMPKFIEEMSSKVSKAQHDIDMSTKVSMQQFNEKLYIINDNTNNTCAGMLFLKALTVNEVARLETKFEEKDKEIEAKMQISMTDLEQRMEDKGAGLEDIIEEKDRCFEAKLDDLQISFLEMQKNLKSLKTDKALKRGPDSPGKGRPRKQSRLSWSSKDASELPKNIFVNKDDYGWRKMVQGSQCSKVGYRTIAEAQAGLALHLDGGASRDISVMMGHRTQRY